VPVVKVLQAEDKARVLVPLEAWCWVS
jgi:hypothetical protein